MTGISEIYDAIEDIAGRLKAIKLEQEDDALYHIRKARASVEELI